jgi:chaperone modulatory protein CbpM
MELLEEWVELGVVEPCSLEGRQWRFRATQLRRVRIARRLQHDLGVEAEALPLVLDMLEELRQLRRKVRTLERLIDD